LSIIINHILIFLQTHVSYTTRQNKQNSYLLVPICKVEYPWPRSNSLKTRAHYTSSTVPYLIISNN